jgi:hypothetical protein
MLRKTVIDHLKTSFFELPPGRATSSAPEAQSSVDHRRLAYSRGPFWGINAGVGRAIHQAGTVLRLRICRSPECRAVFSVCASCDRGQRYCCQTCREHVRHQQLRAANNRYQQSDQGRQSHRHRQRSYRERKTRVRARVTDQGLRTINSSTRLHRPTPSHCAICGRHSHWVNPFPAISRRR